jgi:TP901 family phage tail tape measure protein
LHQVSGAASEHAKIQGRLQKSLGKTRKSFEELSTGAMVGGAVLAGTISSAVDRNLALGKSMAQLSAQAEMSGQSMEGMKDSINRVTDSSSLLRGEVAKLYNTAAQSGLKMGQIEDSVATSIKFAKVAAMDQNESIKNMAQITRAYTLTAQDQVNAMDQIGAVASRTRIGLANFQTMVSHLSQHAAHANVSIADLTTTIGYMSKNMGMTDDQVSGAMDKMFRSIEGASPKASKALRDIGMTSQQLADDVKTRGLGPAMADVAKKVSAAGGDVKGTLTKIMGSSEGAELAMQLMTQDGMSNFQDLANVAQQSAGTIGRALGKLGQDASVQFGKAKNALTNALDEVVAGLIPLLTVGMQAVVGLVNWFKQLPAPVKEAAGAIAGIAVGMVAVSMAVGTVGKVVVDGMSMMVGGVGKARKAIETLSKTASSHSGIIKSALTSIGNGINRAFSMINPSKIIGAIKSVASVVSNFASKIAGLPGAIKGVMSRVISVFTSMPGKILGVVGKIRAVFSGGLVNAIKMAFTAIRAIMAANPIGLALLAISLVIMLVITHWKQFQEAATAAMKKIASIVGPVIEHLKSTFNNLWQTISSVFSQIKAAWERLTDSSTGNSATISAILGVLGTVFSNIFTQIVTTIEVAIDIIAGVIGTLLKVLADIIDFVVDVFTGNWSRAWEDVKKIFVDIIDGIKNIFNNVINDISGALDKIIGKSGDAKSAAQDAESAGGGDGETNDHNASGTTHWKGGRTWINENGPEIVDLPQGTRIHPHDESLRLEYQRGVADTQRNGGGNITIAKLADSIVVHDQQDIDDIATALAYKLKGYAINTMVPTT